MIDNISAVGAGAIPRPQPTSRTPVAAVPPAVQEDTAIPDMPPAEVLHALDRAQEVMADLKSRQLELRFEVADGRIHAQMIDSEGKIVREIPARHGLDLLAGGHLVDQKA